MAMTFRAEVLIIMPRRDIQLDAVACPVIQGLSQARVTRVAHVHDGGPLATPLRDGRDAGVRAQPVIIASAHRGNGLGEHRGGHHSSYAWQGEENLDVTMLLRLVLRSARG